ncbi:hypothetical protein SK803_24035 [Lentzea sp. BCCO 10_0856]|uniref:Lipoprotein n=1 Tax=Lentzea miocenica TaxID=3095431 RepID=A0ABU4T552_9PSEU|nr:hypothetical protein [Lentzea sp. BCCO 10_0856]MDX8033300.1 hypothetical protein [Lentzea sp. BCCO 10_0856]
MKRLIVVALCLLATACAQAPTTTPTQTSTPSPTPSADESPAVRAAFETYTKAALAKDGTTGVSVLAKPIFDTYDDFRKLALTATEQDLSTAPLGKRAAVYTLRGSVDPAILRTASPKELVKVSIDRGLVGEKGINNLELGKITASGDTASAEVLARGQVAPYKFRFVREDGTWKLDLQPLLDLADSAYAEVAKQQNLTPEQFLDGVLNQMYGPAKAAEVRKPLGA